MSGQIKEMSETQTADVSRDPEGHLSIAALAAHASNNRMTQPHRVALDGDMRAAFAAYAEQPFGTRLFLRGRHILCPMKKVAREVPPAGRILDIGCGHGLFPALLASGSSQRTIVGVDPSEGKIDVARGSTKAFPNISYIQGSVLDLNDGPYDAITI